MRLAMIARIWLSGWSSNSTPDATAAMAPRGGPAAAAAPAGGGAVGVPAGTGARRSTRRSGGSGGRVLTPRLRRHRGRAARHFRGAGGRLRGRCGGGAAAGSADERGNVVVRLGDDAD